MELNQIQSLVARLTDEQLAQEMQRPSGVAPLPIIIAEMQRRSMMRGGQPKGYADGGRVQRSDRSQQIWEALQNAGISGRFTGGMRTPETNRRVNGVPNSWHLKGEAVDFVTDQPLDEVKRMIAEAGLPSGELLRHNAGSGMHVHYSPEGLPLAGHPANEAAAPRAVPPITTQAGGFVDPAALQANALGLGSQVAADIGVPQAPASLTGTFNEVSALVPGQGEAYAKAAEQQQAMLKEAQKANKGRALMEMGLAMMSAQTPNFYQALGQGGQAGLGARDRIRAQEQALINQAVQTQLQGSQAEQNRAMALLDAASGQRRSEIAARTQAFGVGSDLARSGAQVQTQAAESAAQDRRQSEELAFRASEGQKDREAQLALVREQASAGRWERKSPEERRQLMFTSAFEITAKQIGQRVRGPDGKMRQYTQEDALRDAQEVANTAIAEQNTGSPQRPTPPVNSNRRPLSEILGD